MVTNILDAEIIDDEGEGDGACAVTKKTWSIGGGKVAVSNRVFYEAKVGKNAGLGKAIHAFADFGHGVAGRCAQVARGCIGP